MCVLDADVPSVVEIRSCTASVRSTVTSSGLAVMFAPSGTAKPIVRFVTQKERKAKTLCLKSIRHRTAHVFETLQTSQFMEVASDPRG